MMKFGIGQAVRRVEDQRFLTGQGRYVDDITLPGICHGVNVLSPHAHARIKNNRLTPVSMEPRAAIGDYNAAEDSYTLYTSSQNPHGARTEIAHILHIAENQLRVVSPDVGGGFGLQGGAFPDDALVLWASKTLRR